MRLATMVVGTVALLCAFTAKADVCQPRALEGPYGFQLSGNTDISGDRKPVASVGRIVFDGKGGISGVSSVNFAGYFLGNPVTGNYEAHDDCTVTWSLQDDSGAFQHFAGTLMPDLTRAQFHQTDPGGPTNGTLAKLADECAPANLRPAYNFTIRGTTIPMNPGDTAERVSLSGAIETDKSGNLSLIREGAAPAAAGTANVGSDCIVEMDFSPPGARSMKLRGVLISGGAEILAMEASAGAAVTAKFTAR